MMMDMRALLVAICCCLLAGTARGVVLVQAGQPAGSLAVGAGAGGAKAAAAVADLQRALEQMSGARLPESGQPVLWVGQPADFPSLRLDKPLGQGEVALLSQQGGLFVLGSSDQAVSDAVYTLLDRLGCRWYLPGEIGEVIPRRPTVDTGDLAVRETPAFQMRQPWYAWGADGIHTSQAGGVRWADWLRRNRCGGEGIAHGHNLLTPIKGMFEQHPEYFALVKGVRRETQPCTSNPALIPIYVAAINKALDAGATSYSLCPEDTDQFCECANCRALDSPKHDPGYGGKVVMTDRLVKFFNPIVTEVRKTHPQAVVSFYGYLNHTEPPTTVKMAPGVAVVVTAQQFCTVHGVSDPQCESRQRLRRILAQYGEQTPYVYIYEYDPAPGSSGVPYPLYFTHARDLRIYRELGVRGFSIESLKAWNSAFPNHWFWARGLWNPDFDERAALHQLCRDLYGPAAAPMERYFTLLAEGFRTSKVHPGWGLGKYAGVWSADQVSELAAALREASQAVQGASRQVRERVLCARLEQRLLADYLEFTAASKANDAARALKLAERIVGDFQTQRDLNEDLCLYVEAAKDFERITLDLRHRWPESAEFAAANDLVCRLPERWRMRQDPGNVGLTEGWQAVNLPLDGWGSIKTSLQWNRQVDNIATVGWARTTFDLPAKLQGRRLILFVGALDEAGNVFVNGRQVVRREPDMSANSWMEPFQVDITDAVQPGKNTIVVRAEAEKGLGGLWRGAVIYSPRPTGGH